MKQFIILVIALFFVLPATAQGKIDRVIADIENKPDVETTYSERRTTKDHKLYRITTVINFRNEAYYKRLVKAFEDERGNTISAVKTHGSHTYKFADNKGTSSYTLTANSVVKVWRRNDDKGGDDESLIETNIDPKGDTFVTTTKCNSKEIAKIQREISRKQAAIEREQAKLQRDIARKQAAIEREQAKMQRDIARRQADIEREQAKMQREFARNQSKRNAKNDEYALNK